MANTYNVAVDAGKGYCKVAYVQLNKERKPIGDVKLLDFPTRYESYSLLRDGVDYLELQDGTKVFVGDEVLAEGTSTDNSKNEDIHRYCIYKALAKILGNGDTANVVIGCPIDIFKNQEQVGVYLNNMIPKGELRFKFNGRDVHFTIDKRSVAGEAFCYISNTPLLHTGKVGIVDLGYLNLNACQFFNGKYVQGTEKTQKCGCGEFVRRIEQNLLSEEFLADYVDKDYIVQYISDGCIKGYGDEIQEKSKEIIDNVVKEVFGRIKAAITVGSWSNYKTIKLVFVGGTSVLLRNYIMEEFPSATVLQDNEARFANVKAFLTII